MFDKNYNPNSYAFNSDGADDICDFIYLPGVMKCNNK